MTTLEKLAVGVTAVAGLKLLIGGAVITIAAGKSVSLGAPDAGAIGATLGPVLAAYAASLHKSFRDENKNGVPDDQER